MLVRDERGGWIGDVLAEGAVRNAAGREVLDLKGGVGVDASSGGSDDSGSRELHICGVVDGVVVESEM